MGCAMETILLIENDSTNLVALSMILRCFGYEVLEASNRGEAWRAWNEYHGPVHLDILDNGKSGELVTRLQILSPQIRALLISDALPAGLADKQNIPCEHALLQKPFRIDTLADTITGLLDEPKKTAVTPV